MVGSAGYYGYYLKTRSFLAIWCLLFIAGILIIAYANNKYYKLKKSKKVFLDSLFIIGICLIPIIPVPHGLSILFMIISGSLYTVKQMQRERKR